jgi:hypothetical protein
MLVILRLDAIYADVLTASLNKAQINKSVKIVNNSIIPVKYILRKSLKRSGTLSQVACSCNNRPLEWGLS